MSKDFKVKNGLQVTTHITSSGNISASGDVTGVTGSFHYITTKEYIAHKGDVNTAIRFTNNKISFDAGGMTFFAVHDDDSAPFTATVNGGGNAINFRALDTNQDTIFKTDSQAFNVGLYYAGNKKLETTNTGIDVTGQITASGNISSSGTIKAATLDADAVTDGLAAVIVAEIDNDEIPIAKLAEDAVTVTAGTNLSGGGSITLGGSATLNVDDAFLKNDANDTTSGIITAAGFTTTGNVITNHITASGNISASGTITAEHFHSSDDVQIDDDLTVSGKGTFGDLLIETNGSNAILEIERDSGAELKIKAQDNQTRITYEGGPLLFDRDESGTNTLTLGIGGNISAPGNISSIGNITASGDISASGIVTAEGLVISDDALITDDLEVRGNTSGSSTSTGSFGMGFFDGRVGINTTSPGSSLEVNEGDIRIDTANNATQALRFSDRGTTKAQIQYKDNGETLNILTGGDTNAIEITNAQSVKFSGPITASGDITASGTITADNYGGNVSGSSTSTGSFGAGFFDNKVGIGTTSPDHALHIVYNNSTTEGSISNNNAVVGLQIENTNASGVSAIHFRSSDADGYLLYDDNGANAGDFHFKTDGQDGTSTVVIKDSGNVGIGLDAPVSKLDVVGDLKVSSHITASGNISGSSTSTITIGGKLQAGSKSFLISKPEGGKLEYGVLEGQQNDVFFRGELKCDNIIHLPQEWEWLVDENTITIQLTSIGKYQELFVKEIKDNKIFISINGMFKTKENIHCYYIIHGTRKDIKLIRNHQW